jgi:hypothetical protein
MIDRLTISTLIQLLTRLQAEHGDLPVIIRDADTGYLIKVSEDCVCIKKERLRIAVDYIDSEFDNDA